MERVKLVMGTLTAIVAGVLVSVPMIVWGLLSLQIIDFISGVLAAGLTGEADSDTGWRGIRKKALTWLLIGMSFVAQQALGDLAPIATAVAGFYAGIEMLSILENAARAGVPVPAFLRAALAQIQEQGQKPAGGVQVHQPPAPPPSR